VIIWESGCSSPHCELHISSSPLVLLCSHTHSLSRRCVFLTLDHYLLTKLWQPPSPLPHGIKLRKQICKVINDSTVVRKRYSCPCVHWEVTWGKWGITPLIFNLCTRWNEWLLYLHTLPLGKEHLVPTKLESGWVIEGVGCFEEEKISCSG